MFVWLVVHTATPVQKALHVGIYGALAVLWMWTLEPIESRLLRIVLALVASVGLGALLEWHQTRVPGRFGTVLDVILNAAGAIAGLLLALALL
jgi:VanZ family protein